MTCSLLTFASTTHAIVRFGLESVFCDIDPVTYTMDVSLIPCVKTIMLELCRKQIVFMISLVISLFTIIWLYVFETIALDYAGMVDQDTVLNQIVSPETAVFIVFDEVPTGFLMSVMVIVLLILFFITSADSATYSLNMITSSGSIREKAIR